MKNQRNSFQGPATTNGRKKSSQKISIHFLNPKNFQKKKRNFAKKKAFQAPETINQKIHAIKCQVTNFPKLLKILLIKK